MESEQSLGQVSRTEYEERMLLSSSHNPILNQNTEKGDAESVVEWEAHCKQKQRF